MEVAYEVLGIIGRENSERDQRRIYKATLPVGSVVSIWMPASILSSIISFIHLKPTGMFAFCTDFNPTINRMSTSS